MPGGAARFAFLGIKSEYTHGRPPEPDHKGELWWLAGGSPQKVTDQARGRSIYRLMDSQSPPTPEDLRADARNTLRLAEIAHKGREKAMLLHAANEFLNKAAELEALGT